MMGQAGVAGFWPILGNSQRLDGGAMFGNAPRAVWARWAPPDDQNRIALACRALLLQEGPRGGVAPEGAREGMPERPHTGPGRGRFILAEAGIGAFFEPRLRDRYGVVESEHVLLDQLAALDLTDADIDVVVLSHLHFDHAGGLLAAHEPGAPPRLLFPNATFVVGRQAWTRARSPHSRDRASFIPELPDLLLATGRLEIVGDDASPVRSEVLGPAYAFSVSHGHTPGQLHLEAPTPLGPLVYGGDLVPGRPWMHLPITMGYDRFPERLIDEKATLLTALEARRGLLFFAHDPEVAYCRVARDERGRFVPAAV